MAVKKKKRGNERRYRCQGVCGWVVFIAYYICYLTFSLLAGREGVFYVRFSTTIKPTLLDRGYIPP